ncbi:potassium-transporting ATPase subunit F [Brevibacillus fluminis]|uniref:Potassium-transporting ATPase subunit F n=1 Tax=Brevibacillus fluminis TaxID=511487 RepID=A0A3M8DHL8_9BACL|nr:potassium-transporting ATPase subunit F [Brevibacillus fluminis]
MILLLLITAGVTGYLIHALVYPEKY